MTAVAGPGAPADRPRILRLGSGWLVPALDALIEGSWIAVVDAVFASLAGHAALGPFPFAIAAGASLYIVRHAADRTSAFIALAILYPAAAIAAAFLGGALAGAVASDGQSIVFAQGPALFAVLAVFRGSRHVNPADDDVVVGSVLQWGFPLLAVPWVYASQLPGPEREAFTAAAFPATLLFAAMGLLALGLARLDALTSLSGVNWRSNRAWFALLAAVLGVMLAIALPSAFLLGTPLTLLAAGLLGPLSIILGPIGAVLLKILEFILFLLTPFIDFLQSLIRRAQDQPTPPPNAGGNLVPPVTDQGEPSTLAVIVVVGLGVALALGLFALLLRMTYRRPAIAEPMPGEPFEEREFRLPSLRLRRPRLGLPHRRLRPTTATGAYLAFLTDLEDAPDLARRSDEPPATHAARLRRAGFGDARAALLAADYELEQYALRTVSPKETRRALRRQVGLRDALRLRPRPRPASPESDQAG